MFYRLDDGRFLSLTHFDGVGAVREKGLPADARHYALTTPDLASWRERLAADGIEPVEEDHGRQVSLFVQVPEGTMWEITSPRQRRGAERGPSADVVARYLAGRADGSSA